MLAQLGPMFRMVAGATSFAATWVLDPDLRGHRLLHMLHQLSRFARRSTTGGEDLSGSEVTWTTIMPDGSELESSSTVSIVGGDLRFETELGEFMLQRVPRVAAACRPILD